MLSRSWVICLVIIQRMCCVHNNELIKDPMKHMILLLPSYSADSFIIQGKKKTKKHWHRDYKHFIPFWWLHPWFNAELDLLSFPLYILSQNECMSDELLTLLLSLQLLPLDLNERIKIPRRVILNREKAFLEWERGGCSFKWRRVLIMNMNGDFYLKS